MHAQSTGEGVGGVGLDDGGVTSIKVDTHIFTHAMHTLTNRCTHTIQTHHAHACTHTHTHTHSLLSLSLFSVYI